MAGQQKVGGVFGENREEVQAEGRSAERATLGETGFVGTTGRTMRNATAAIALAVCIQTAAFCEEPRWQYREAKDDLTEEIVKSIAVIDETGKHVLVLSDAGGKLRLTLTTNGLGDAIFPDSVQKNTVEVTIRGSKTKAKVIPLATIPQNLTSAHVRVDPKAATEFLSGDFVIIQINKTGKRYRFPTSGEGLEGFHDAIAKVARSEESTP